MTFVECITEGSRLLFSYFIRSIVEVIHWIVDSLGKDLTEIESYGLLLQHLLKVSVYDCIFIYFLMFLIKHPSIAP